MSKSKLTAEEQRMVFIAKAGASHEVDSLVKIIERLSKEEIQSADEPKNKLDTKAKVEFRG